jgi:hypothetical protein
VDVLSEKERDETEEFENMAEGKEKYLLRLYVTGMTPRSVLAIENIRRICEERLKGRYERARASLRRIDVRTSAKTRMYA